MAGHTTTTSRRSGSNAYTDTNGAFQTATDATQASIRDLVTTQPQVTAMDRRPETWGTSMSHPCPTQDQRRIADRLYALLKPRAPPGTRTPNPRIKSPMLLISDNVMRHQSVPSFAAHYRSA